MLQSAQVIKYDAAKRQTPQDWSVKDPDKVWVPTKTPVQCQSVILSHGFTKVAET
jgi:hypothetical protein